MPPKFWPYFLGRAVNPSRGSRRPLLDPRALQTGVPGRPLHDRRAFPAVLIAPLPPRSFVQGPLGNRKTWLFPEPHSTIPLWSASLTPPSDPYGRPLLGPTASPAGPASKTQARDTPSATEPPPASQVEDTPTHPALNPPSAHHWQAKWRAGGEVRPGKPAARPPCVRGDPQVGTEDRAADLHLTCSSPAPACRPALGLPCSPAPAGALPATPRLWRSDPRSPAAAPRIFAGSVPGGGRPPPRPDPWGVPPPTHHSRCYFGSAAYLPAGLLLPACSLLACSCWPAPGLLPWVPTGPMESLSGRLTCTPYCPWPAPWPAPAVRISRAPCPDWSLGWTRLSGVVARRPSWPVPDLLPGLPPDPCCMACFLPAPRPALPGLLRPDPPCRSGPVHLPCAPLGLYPAPVLPSPEIRTAPSPPPQIPPLPPYRSPRAFLL